MFEFDTYREACHFRDLHFSDCPFEVSIIKDLGKFYIYVDCLVGSAFMDFYEKNKSFFKDYFSGDLF